MFRLAAVEDRTVTGDTILNELQNPFTKTYLEFLEFVLPNLMAFNKLFQSERPLIGELLDECFRLVRLICIHFVKADYLSNDCIKTLNVNDESFLLPPNDGAGVKNIISS